MTFQPHPTRMGYVAIGFALVCLLLALYCLNALPAQWHLAEIFSLTTAVLVAFIFAMVAVAAAIILFNLSYHLSRNGLIIQLGWWRRHIPMADIQSVIISPDLPKPRRFFGLWLPGFRFGWGHISSVGTTRFYTTNRLANSVLVVTADQAYFISPHSADTFYNAFSQRQQLERTQEWSSKIERLWPFNIPIMTDYWFWGLIISTLSVCIALFGDIALRFDALPRTLPIQIEQLGGFEQFTDKAYLFLFPLIGAGVWLFNLLLSIYSYNQERLAAYFVCASGFLVQILLWLTVRGIVM